MSSKELTPGHYGTRDGRIAIPRRGWIALYPSRTERAIAYATNVYETEEGARTAATGRKILAVIEIEIPE